MCIGFQKCSYIGQVQWVDGGCCLFFLETLHSIYGRKRERERELAADSLVGVYYKFALKDCMHLFAEDNLPGMKCHTSTAKEDGPDLELLDQAHK